MSLWRAATTPFRLVPWWGYLALAAVLAWFGRNILLIIATIIAFHPIPIPPLFMGDPETIEEARLQDLQHFDHVRRNERSLSAEQREDFADAVEALRGRVGDLSDAQFLLELARLQARIDNGHSNASLTRMVEGFDRLPVRSAWFGDELRILRTRGAEYEDLLGARVLAVNAVPAREAAARFRDTLGGNDAYFDSVSPLYLETPAYLAAEGIGARADAADYHLVMTDGTERIVTLPAFEPETDATRVYPGDLLQVWRTENEAWQSFQPTGAPAYLSHRDREYWFEEIGDGLVYLVLRSNLDDDSGESLRDFSARAIEEIGAIGPRAIFVDQRFNGGGDLTITAELMRALPELVADGGPVYLLVSGNTFSAGIVNLAMAKEAAPERTVLVGSEIGDRLQFWAEGFWYNLPNSNFRARYSTGFYDLQNGCQGIFICHWGSLHIFPVIVDDLDVDLPAPMTFEAYAAGRDPALDAVLADLQSR